MPQPRHASAAAGALASFRSRFRGIGRGNGGRCAEDQLVTPSAVRNARERTEASEIAAPDQRAACDHLQDELKTGAGAAEETRRRSRASMA
jgi:hypothetical protein